MDHPQKLQQAGAHFLDFLYTLSCLMKKQFCRQNQIRSNSLRFHMLMTLESLSGQSLTMSDLARELDITKQQLTALVNNLEEKGLVRRVHSQHNRRQVYISITEEGQQLIQALNSRRLQDVSMQLERFSPEELEELDYCLTTLTRMLSKFG